MDFIELVKKRRSIRSFNGRPVPREHLTLCTEAATYAPSACNSQPWALIIVDDEKQKKLLSNNIFKGIYKRCAFAKTAGAYIVVVSERPKITAALGGLLRNTDFKKIDVGIATEHLVLQATELGIDSCYLGWFNERKTKKILKIPSSKKVELVIALGYRNDIKLRDRRLKETNDVIKINKYSSEHSGKR